MEERQNLTKEEIETLINYTNADTYAEAYSNNTSVMKRYLKLAKEKPEEVTVINSDANSVTIRFPKKWVKIRPPRAISEEQRLAAAERLKNFKNKDVQVEQEDILENEEDFDEEDINDNEDFY